MSNTDLCTTCGKTLQTGSSDSVTRWLFPGDRCSCGRQQLVNAPEVTGESSRICLTCGKLKGSAKTGSLTQWIFSAARCRCDFDKIARSVQNASEVKPTGRVDNSARPARLNPPSQREAINETAAWAGEVIELDSSAFPIDRYMPKSLLGQGGLGQVYLCWDQLLKKKVAVKCLLSLTEERIVSFQNEAKLAGRLNHESLSKVLDFGITGGGRPFLVMEYFEGPTLQQVIAERDRLSDSNCLALMISISGGLQSLHSNGVLHRDLKPSNILVSKSSAQVFSESAENTEEFTPEVRLIDFGLSKSTADLQSKTLVHGKTVVGTPTYTSPDQIAGREYDARSEIYSFGCIMFETLTGRPPFQGATSLEVLTHHANSELKLPAELHSGIELDLFTIIQTCMAKDPADRFQSVDSLLQALQLLQDRIRAGKEKSITMPASVRSTPKGKSDLLVVSLGILLSLTALACCFLFLPGTLLQATKDSAPYVKLDDNYGSMLNDLTVDTVKSGVDRGSKRLNLVGLSDEELLTIGRAPAVEELVISGSTISDQGIGYLMPEKLLSLDASGSSVCTLNNIGKLRNLQRLIIRHTGVTDDALESLRFLKRLDCLDASDIGLTDKAIPKIANLNSLVTLNLSDTNISGQTLPDLSKIRTLRDVSLKRTAIKMAEVRRFLSSSPWIQVLDITNCPNINAAQIWLLEREFPRTSFSTTNVDKLSFTIDVRYGELSTEGELAFSQQQYATAINKYQECIHLLTDSGKKSTRVSVSRLLTCHENIGNAAVLSGQTKLAEKSFKDGALLARKAGFPDKATEFLIGLTRSYVYAFDSKAADLKTTELSLLNSISFSRQLFGNDIQETAEIYSQLADVMIHAGQWEKARNYVRKAMAINDPHSPKPRNKILDETISKQLDEIQQHLKSK